MERLTKYDGEKYVQNNNCDSKKANEWVTERQCLQKLGNYENIGLTPNEISILN